MYISISQLKDYSISVDQARYATYVVTNYLYNSTIKNNSKFCNTTLPCDMIFTTEDASVSDEQVELISR